jgi:hypothetical protein
MIVQGTRRGHYLIFIEHRYPLNVARMERSEIRGSCITVLPRITLRSIRAAIACEAR